MTPSENAAIRSTDGGPFCMLLFCPRLAVSPHKRSSRKWSCPVAARSSVVRLFENPCGPQHDLLGGFLSEQRLSKQRELDCPHGDRLGNQLEVVFGEGFEIGEYVFGFKIAERPLQGGDDPPNVSFFERQFG